MFVTFLPGSQTYSCCPACGDSVLSTPIRQHTVTPHPAAGPTQPPRKDDDGSASPDNTHSKQRQGGGMA